MTLENQKKSSPGPPKDTKMLPKSIPQDTKLLSGKSEIVENILFYNVYSTCRHCIPALFPSLDHQKHGPGNCLPFYLPKSQKNHKIVPKVSPRKLPKSIFKINKKRQYGPQCVNWVPPWTHDHQNGVQGLKEHPQGRQNFSFS